MHFDRFTALRTPDIGALLPYNNKLAASFGAGNELRTDVSTVRFATMDPKSVLFGCILSRNLRAFFDALPSGNPLIDILRMAALGQSGAFVTPVTCDLTVTVLGMASKNGKSGDTRLAELRATKKDSVTCNFTPNGVIPGTGIGIAVTPLKECDLSRYGWTDVTRLGFSRKSTAIAISETGTGSVTGAIEDFQADGRLRLP